jgi:Fe-S cluster assembly protein SufD
MSDTSLKSYTATTDLQTYQRTLAGPSWLAALRTAAAASFTGAQWPTTSEEEWRRTSLRAFEFDTYRAGGEPSTDDGPSTTAAAGSAPTETSSESEETGAAGHLTFHNDRVVSSAVREDLASGGVVFGALTGIMSDAGDAGSPATGRIRETLSRSFDSGDNRFEHWHNALLAEAAVLYVPRFTEIAEPFVVDFHLNGDEVVVAPHVLVVLEEGARATVVKRLISETDGEVLVVDADDLVVGDSARLQISTVQNLNGESVIFSNGRGVVGRDGQLHRDEAALGGDFVKSRFVCNLEGAGADAALNGLYFGNDEQHLDLRTVQRHAAPSSTSRAFYRGAVLGESHSIYQGLITVAAEARGTDAYLTNKNLILSDDARADSIPSLKINTDDVKCSHGSTTGKLDAAQLFYLQSRGYDSEEARLTLIEGYFEDLIAQAPEMIQDEIRDLIAQRLADADDA